ncbi:N-terminal domain of Peptidase_S41 [Sphingopyxis sp. YR583]|uniref:S41 family peptidase n=1 Tax=Sphingopyxis sp. YR583 TaxID=1881047 RepID=UPI0008A77D75|nr:S41 family peptidase [Sphingopyxis sp. YR583]SEH13638.1 N-terminal domain of Peptidase_S41 [Sphingopyxis sp. YR583]
MNIRHWALILAATASSLVSTAAAQDAPFTAADKRAVVEQLGQTLEANYVFPEKAKTIAATLRRHLDAGDYDAAPDRRALASKLTDDLIAASSDLHFAVGVDPLWVADYAAKQDPARVAALREEERRDEARKNFGFAGLRYLDGNIAYIDLTHFADPELGYDAAAAAMRFIENGDAVIYDLRYNNGGHLEMAQLLASQLFRGDKDVELFDYYYTLDGRRVERGQWVLPALPAKRLTGKPVYVLTGSTSFSAAEWFAYTLKKLGRATLVGERTAGGAHPVDRKPVGTDFFLQVPIGQIRDPVDRSDFEGRGVTPDHPVASADALAVAHRLALADLAKADPAKRAEADWLAPELSKRPQPSATALKAVAGRYEGRRIDLVDGKLLYTWRGRFRLMLEPLAGDLLGLEGVRDFRFRIVRKGGKVTALERIDRDGTTQSYARLD